MCGSVLIVDDDDMTVALVAEVLADEGFTVTHLGNTTSDAIRAAVNRLEPDVVLLDGSDKLGYSDSWPDAAGCTSGRGRSPSSCLRVMPTILRKGSSERRSGVNEPRLSVRRQAVRPRHPARASKACSDELRGKQRGAYDFRKRAGNT
jgi:DNA-binding NarL/FixJ family response regulator